MTSAEHKYRIGPEGQRQRLTANGWVDVAWGATQTLSDRKAELDRRKPKIGSRNYARRNARKGPPRRQKRERM